MDTRTDAQAAAARLQSLLDRLDQHGAVAVAAELGEHRTDVAYAVVLGHLQAAAKDLLRLQAGS